MSRFFVSGENIDVGNNSIIIENDDVNHIKNVLRLKQGDEITVCDGNSTDYVCTIKDILKNVIHLDILSSSKCDTEPLTGIVLYQGISKGERMDTTIQKCVELGVTSIVPVICRRTIVRFKDDRDMISKREKWQKISQEAAKQCNRGRIPDITMPVTFSNALSDLGNYELKIIPYEEAEDVNLKSILLEYGHPVRTAFFIGPEGGFEKEEIIQAENAGCIPITLGKRILRTETAGPAVLAIIRNWFGD